MVYGRDGYGLVRSCGLFGFWVESYFLSMVNQRDGNDFFQRKKVKYKEEKIIYDVISSFKKGRDLG